MHDSGKERTRLVSALSGRAASAAEIWTCGNWGETDHVQIITFGAALFAMAAVGVWPQKLSTSRKSVTETEQWRTAGRCDLLCNVLHETKLLTSGTQCNSTSHHADPTNAWYEQHHSRGLRLAIN